MTQKVMKLISPYTGLMECRVCGARHFAMLKSGGHYYRGAWQCVHGCKRENEKQVAQAVVDGGDE
jgi:hypothetical protein